LPRAGNITKDNTIQRFKKKWKALEIIKKAAEEYNSLDSLDNDHAGLAAASLYVARVLEKRELEMKPS